MLAAEFGYSRNYVDTYINMPSLRSIKLYRSYNPPVGAILKALFSDGKSENKSVQKEGVSSEFLSMENVPITKLTEKQTEKYKNLFEQAKSI